MTGRASLYTQLYDASVMAGVTPPDPRLPDLFERARNGKCYRRMAELELGLLHQMIPLKNQVAELIDLKERVIIAGTLLEAGTDREIVERTLRLTSVQVDAIIANEPVQLEVRDV